MVFSSLLCSISRAFRPLASGSPASHWRSSLGQTSCILHSADLDDHLSAEMHRAFLLVVCMLHLSWRAASRLQHGADLLRTERKIGKSNLLAFTSEL